MPLFFIALAFTLFWLGGITANIGSFTRGWAALRRPINLSPPFTVSSLQP